jgi:hypothetical protein
MAKKRQAATPKRPLTEDELDPAKHPFTSPRRLAQAGFADHTTLLKAIHAGRIPAIQYQRTFRIPTRWVRRALGLDDLAVEPTDADELESSGRT